MIPTLGRLATHDPREIWKNEERDFTPWLAANVNELSDLLGVQITVQQIEQRVGSYELDIFGRVEENDSVVIIENQLGSTDHSHLGQLITYAAGLEAAIVIWVATDVRPEHKAAIEWLNQHADDTVSFFLVQPEVLSINGSTPAVRFELAAAPSEFARRLRNVVNEDRPSFVFRRRFWEALFEYLPNHGHSWARGRATTKDNWISSSVGRSNVHVNVSMAVESRMRVEIYLSGLNAKAEFDEVYRRKREIDALFPEERISWERLDEAVAARIAVYRAYDKTRVADDTPERRELFGWIASNLTTMRKVATRYIVDTIRT